MPRHDTLAQRFSVAQQFYLALVGSDVVIASLGYARVRSVQGVLAESYQATRVRTDSGHVGIAELLASVQVAIKTILEARTGRAPLIRMASAQNKLASEIGCCLHAPLCVIVSQREGDSRSTSLALC